MKPAMTVLAARGAASFTDAQRAALDAVAAVRFHAVVAHRADDALAALCADAAVVGLTRRATTDVHAGLVASLPRLRALVIHATGTEWVDRVALDARGIAFDHLPDYSATTVAEHALGMLLALSRRLHLSDRVARGDLTASTSLRGFELRGRCIGIIGMGRIGGRVARLARAFGMRVVFHDPAVPSALDADAMPIDALLADADIVLLACSQARGAPPLIGAPELARMKPGAMLVNPTRKGLVDGDGVLVALRHGRLAGYAVDDCAFAPAVIASFEPGRLLQTAHTAWYSDEAIARGMDDWVARLVRAAKGVTDAV